MESGQDEETSGKAGQTHGSHCILPLFAALRAEGAAGGNKD